MALFAPSTAMRKKKLPNKQATAVYVLECEEGAWYVGMTSDPNRRWNAHLDGKGAAYTQHYKPLRMVVCAWCKTRKQAEGLEIALTEELGRHLLKVAGGKRTCITASGRGTNWSEEAGQLWEALEKLRRMTVLAVNVPEFYLVDGKRTRPWRVTSSTLTSQRYTVNMLDSEIIGL